MGTSCSYVPTKKGEELKGFRKYRKQLGYTLASDIF